MASYDAIVVGARCAGAPLAMLLARRGCRVLLVDRATFPSDIPHGHFINRRGPSTLARWGLLDSIVARTPPVVDIVFDAGDFPLAVHDLIENGVPWGCGPRRFTLDKILVDAAVESGAELREAFTVEDYLFDDDRVVGIRGRDRSGRIIDERAAITVGADGRHSRLARAAQAPTYDEIPTLLCYYFSYWSDVVDAADFELYVRREARRVIFSFKTERDLFAVFVGFPIEEFPRIHRDPEPALMESIDTIAGFGERIRSGRRVERLYGASDLPNFYRKPYGPGWALVGDAGAHKDPYLALGICDGFRDAEFLDEAIHQGLSGARPMADALADYERRRNEASRADYAENIASARFVTPPPAFFALREALRHAPEEATRLLKARNGLIDLSSGR